jgi:5'-deoxynucleotidase YfbR-like HD superfamily hydrolase
MYMQDKPEENQKLEKETELKRLPRFRDRPIEVMESVLGHSLNHASIVLAQRREAREKEGNSK